MSRAQEVCDIALKNGLTTALISSPDFDRAKLPDVSVVNVLGKLSYFYRNADLALVGGSFLPGQGHNPLEPAAVGRAAIIGPNMSSFSEEARFLMDNLASKMVLPVNLYSIFSHFLELPELARSIGINARQLVAGMNPAAPLIAGRIIEILKQRGKL